MRIHSDVLSPIHLIKATDNLPGVYVTYSQRGSLSHARAFEVSLEGNGYRKSTGQYGAGDEFGATWDEWGVFIARLFDTDPEAVFGSVKYPVYANSYDFHAKTNDRFADLALPKDTHKRHNFRSFEPGAVKCTKCSAIKKWSY